MKRRRYLQIILALVVTLIIGGTVLINSPRVQQRVSVALATELENRIGTRVNLDGVRWLFPNDIVIDSLAIDDQEGEPLIVVNRVAAKVEWMPLIRHRQLSIRNIRIFGPDINLYQTEPEGEFNYQFLIDAFASKEKKKKKSLDLSMRVNTLILKDGRVKYQPCGKGLQLSDLSAQMALKMLSTDSVSFIVRHLGFKEQSGLVLDDLYFRLVGNRQGATLANFQVDLPHSSLRLDTLWASYEMMEGKLANPVLKGGILPSSHITPSDLAFALPQVKGLNERVYLGGDFIGSPERIQVKALDLHSAKRDLALRAEARVVLDSGSRPISSLALNLEQAAITKQLWALLKEGAPDIHALIPEEIIRIGNIAAKGNIQLESKQAKADLSAQTDAGDLIAHIDLDEKGHYTATLDGDSLNIAQVVPTSPLASTNLALRAKGLAEVNDSVFNIQSTKLAIVLTQTNLLGYAYDRITLDGHYSPKEYGANLCVADPNAHLKFEAAYDATGSLPHYAAMLDADSLALHTLGLIDLHEGNTFSTNFTADLHGRDLDHIVGKVIIDSLAMHRPTGDDYLIREVALYASDPESKMLSLKSDFMDATLRGKLTYSSLISSLLGHLHHSLPSLCQSHDHKPATDANLCLANVEIYNTEPLRELLRLPITTTGKAQFDALVNDAAGEVKFTASVPQVEYDGNLIKGVTIDLHAVEQGLDLYAGATLHNEDTPSLTASLTTKATNDVADLALLWASDPSGAFEGSLCTQATLSLDEKKRLCVAIETDSTSVILNHSEWAFEPFRLGITPERISIDSLHFASATQHLTADGIIARNETDTLQVSFMGLDLGYLLSLVKLKGISFDGSVSGRADIAGLYSPQPYIEAAITAEDFTFCEGPLGDVDGRIHWDQETSQLQFKADVSEEPTHTTVVDGHVDFKQDELWINIAADSTNVSFLNSMLNSFMNDIRGHAHGNLIVGGPLDALNLSGTLLADVDFNLTPTNVRYHFRDSLRFTPDVIHFNGIEAFDYRQQKAIVNGTVKHNAIKDFAADLYIDAQNVLGVDLPDTGHDSFYTTIYGTGGVHVTASPTTPLVVDIQAQSEKGSIFALNLASQNQSQSEKFITFTNRSNTRNTTTATTLTTNRPRPRQPESVSPAHLKIGAQITPDATLKLVMNQAIDDHISIRGSGDLQISSQGSEMKLFGTYTAERGYYHLSLQDVINKSFDVLPGSTVSFDGDYMNTRLNITARHIVNYVPLRDLSPELTGNVHVNCLLHIGGTLDTPTLTFDLELPKGTEEEKAILRSYTNTEEQMSKQFIYLLGLGKFYTPDMAPSEQSTNDMESFISNTISGQINSILSNIISNENWNFASNLRTENMMTGANELNGENWENMEIEGILEGRLLNNRLIINGSFGYRDNPMYATNFIGDFDIRYRLTSGLSLRGYNKTNDRYFSRTSLTTQGLGLVFQRDFERLIPQRKRKQTEASESAAKKKKKRRK